MSNVEKFYEWMENMENVFLNDNEKMIKAFHKVANSDVNDIEVINPVIVKGNE